MTEYRAAEVGDAAFAVSPRLQQGQQNQDTINYRDACGGCPVLSAGLLFQNDIISSSPQG